LFQITLYLIVNLQAGQVSTVVLSTPPQLAA
jgi:hypothetical protein